MYALQKDIHETKVLGDIHQVNADFSIKGVGREYWKRDSLRGWRWLITS
jgi:hypothetical protein